MYFFGFQVTLGFHILMGEVGCINTGWAFKQFPVLSQSSDDLFLLHRLEKEVKNARKQQEK